MKFLAKYKSTPGVEGLSFESMNKMTPLSGLVEKKAEIVSGMENVWYEYVPKCYDGTRAFPLVVQLHGGGNDGRRWADNTIWHEMAERQGLIVIYPDSPNYGSWHCDDTDVKYLYDLILTIKNAYRIDASRIYMQGMSNGDMMTLAFTLRHPEVLAAAGYATGPTAPELLDGDRPVGALPIIQMRGEMDVNWMLTPETVDVYAKRYAMNDLNREIWEEVNGTKGVLPTLTLRGKDNFLFYAGEKAPIINWEIASMGHREPAYGAQVFWDRLYSGAALDGETHTVGTVAQPLPGDDDTVILSLGSNKIYRKNEILTMADSPKAIARIFTPSDPVHFCPVKLGEMGEVEVMEAPVEFFRAAYGAEIAQSPDGDTAVLTFPDGRRVTLRASSVLMEIDGSFAGLQKPCVARGGYLFCPVGEICAQLFDAQVSFADDVLCISSHYAVLGRYTASILRRLLGGAMRDRKRPENW